MASAIKIVPGIPTTKGRGTMTKASGMTTPIDIVTIIRTPRHAATTDFSPRPATSTVPVPNTAGSMYGSTTEESLQSWGALHAGRLCGDRGDADREVTPTADV
jgi:hypothetical protein